MAPPFSSRALNVGAPTFAVTFVFALALLLTLFRSDSFAATVDKKLSVPALVICTSISPFTESPFAKSPMFHARTSPDSPDCSQAPRPKVTC